jgi:hypothetical protein
MTIHGNLEEFAGKPVVDFAKAGDVADFATTVPRLRCEYDYKHSLRDLLSQMLDQPGVGAAKAIVFGLWMENGESYEVTPQSAIELLVSAKDKLPNVEALFFGDIISEENEISWIGQGNYSTLWRAFPRLGHFGVRGGNTLSLGAIDHPALHTLVVEAGGLPASVVREALAAKAPIRHLELWLGDENYGADTSVADFKDLFAGTLFPDLHTLALRNSEYTDGLAEALATAPITDRIKVLDLSMGTLTDKGARALIQSDKIAKLEKLDISFHYVSEPVIEELHQATPHLVADDPQKAEEWDGKLQYYVAVSE